MLPAPITVLPAGEAESLVTRAAKGARPGGLRQVGGITLEVTGGGGPDQLVWGTFGRQEGLMALYSGGRPVATLDKGLGEILRVQPLALPGLPAYAIMVDDRYDEMVGAFLKEERRRIYVWDGRGLRQVFAAPLESEQYTHARWENPRGPNAWRLKRVLGEVTVRDGRLTQVERHQDLEAPGAPDAPMPEPKAFRLLREDRQEKQLTWNARLRRFDA